eukprot:tig00000624_g2640.t1
MLLAAAASTSPNPDSPAPPSNSQAVNEDLLRELRELRGQVERLKRSEALQAEQLEKLKLHGQPRSSAREDSIPSARDEGDGSGARAAHAQKQHAQQLERAKVERAQREEIERLRAAQEGHYIVGLKEGATEEHAEAVRGHARAAARRHHGGAHEEHVRFHHTFSHALRGFSARYLHLLNPRTPPPPPRPPPPLCCTPMDPAYGHFASLRAAVPWVFSVFPH